MFDLSNVDSQTVGVVGSVAMGIGLLFYDQIEGFVKNLRSGSESEPVVEETDLEKQALGSTLLDCLPECIAEGKQSSWNLLYKMRLEELQREEDAETTN